MKGRRPSPFSSIVAFCQGPVAVALLFALLLAVARWATPAAPSDPPPVDSAWQRDRVVSMMEHAWDEYLAAAAEADDVRPVSGRVVHRSGTAAAAFAAGSALATMRLARRAAQARRMMLEANAARAEWAAPVAEIVERYVAGALALYGTTGHRQLVDKAVEIADVLAPAFSTTCPATVVDLPVRSDRKTATPGVLEIGAAAAPQSTLRYLSQLTGNDKYAVWADVFTGVVNRTLANGFPRNAALYDEGAPRMPHVGLLPGRFDPAARHWAGAASFGPESGRYYAGLLTQWIAGGRQATYLADRYEEAVEAVLTEAACTVNGTATLGYVGVGFTALLDHDACAVPGMLALGLSHGVHRRPGRRQRTWSEAKVLAVATALAATCRRVASNTATGLPPASVMFDARGAASVTDPSFRHGPAAAASALHLYRFTKDDQYRRWGAELRAAIEAHCRAPHGYSVVDDVTTATDARKDEGDIAALSATLQYLYLLFAEGSPVDPAEWVFIGEGHPVRILR